MICYRDRTFCEAACRRITCDRMLTDKVKADARRWWGGEGAPIAVVDLSDRCPAYEPLSTGPKTPVDG